MTIFQPSSETPLVPNLYEQDFYLWLEQTVKLLKENNFSALDRDNLIEELESMGRSEKRAIESNLRVLLMHLLKYQAIALRAREQGTGNREQGTAKSKP